MPANKELRNLLDHDIRNPTSLSKHASPTSTRPCHYTLHLYSCTHKSFLIHPRITHIPPCPLSPTYFPNPDLFQKGDHQETKKRCNNMAQKPKEVYIDGVCPKCRPFSLGMGDPKQVRGFEPMISVTAEKREQSVAKKGKRKAGKEEAKLSLFDGDMNEIQKAFSNMSLRTQKQPSPGAEPPSQRLTRAKNDSKVSALAKKVPEQDMGSKPLASSHLRSDIPSPDPILEQPTDSTIEAERSELQEKKERWVDVSSTCDSEVAPSDTVNKPGRGIFSRIFKPFGGLKKEEGTDVDEQIQSKEGGQDARAAIAGKVGVEGVGTSAEWENLSDEDKKEKLWKDEDEGEWVNIKE